MTTAGMVRCAFRGKNAQQCRSAPMRDEPYCFWHSPDHAQEATEARRLGGLRRKRELAVSGAYELHGLASVLDVRRLLEIAVLDTLALENGVARSRTLAYLAQVSLKALEVGELEARLGALETAVRGRRDAPKSAFDTDPLQAEGLL